MTTTTTAAAATTATNESSVPEPGSCVGAGDNSDIAQRDDLVAIVRSIAGEPLPPSVLVSLEGFFQGNRDLASIAPNLICHPGTEQIYESLRAIRDRPDVDDVLVDALLGYSADHPGDEWPLAQAIIVVTSATPGEVDEWTRPLQTDLAFPGLWTETTVNPPRIPDGYHIITVWWD